MTPKEDMQQTPGKPKKLYKNINNMAKRMTLSLKKFQGEASGEK